MSDDIPASTKATEAVDLFSSTTVLAVLYTFSVMLYYLCARLTYRQARNLDGRIKKRTVFTFGLTSVMIICATMDVVLINRYMQLVYIEYSHLPGGPLGVQAQLHTVKTAMIDLIIALIEEIVATGVLVWRVWVVWSGTRYFLPITTLSVALYLAYTVSYTLNIVVAFTNFIPNFATTPQLSRIVVVMTLGLSSASTIFMTSVVILRLMLVRWQHIKVIGKTEASAHYLSIVAMLVESYALLTIWTIMNLIFYLARDAHAGGFVNNSISCWAGTGPLHTRSKCLPLQTLRPKGPIPRLESILFQDALFLLHTILQPLHLAPP
ncbi:hypothetical protein AGABI2DRAFT_120814 [Agaricus bisporus var. bisporus H97]|uniref:hypothetical protein n=1 Tax=Agaricus bisporus var. bisporus (strain H97 / ATCC MYA-4626 / FGSC 10389) TaxID=936046 RepID=UPI00029F707A|nr:hypothetical protein AGABI2DRAFT_120814 [Agaricus bisporus var. bisporus H97]EKV44687.1 hypothetical protein AGABI2DRAFT_120814 [Agaricus bisporus var. bisporus H97]